MRGKQEHKYRRTLGAVKQGIDGKSCIVINVKVKVLVAQSCPTLSEPMDCSPPGPSVHGILQARILEWVAMSSSKDLPQGSNLGLLHWQADS